MMKRLLKSLKNNYIIKQVMGWWDFKNNWIMWDAKRFSYLLEGKQLKVENNILKKQ